MSQPSKNNSGQKYKRLKFVPGVNGLSGLPSINLVINNSESKSFYYKQGKMSKFFDQNMNQSSSSPPSVLKKDKQIVKRRKKHEWVVYNNLTPSPIPISPTQHSFRIFLDQVLINPTSDLISCIESFLTPGELHWITLMKKHSNKQNYRLKPPQAFYRGPATDATKIPDLQPLNNLEHIDYSAFERHLLQLYFNHFHPFCIVVHPGLLSKKLSRPQLDQETQLLLWSIMAVATKYLDLKPFEGAPHPSIVVQYYRQKAINLYHQLLDKPSITLIQVSVLLINLDYQNTPIYFERNWKIIDQLNLTQQFLRPQEEILKTKPKLNSIEYSEELMQWEENLMIWSIIVFRTLFISTGNVFASFETKLLESPYLMASMDALFVGPISPSIMPPQYLDAWYLQYSIGPILSEIIKNNRRLKLTASMGKLPSEDDYQQLNRIKFKLSKWQKCFDRFQLQTDMPTKLLLMIGLSLHHYHFSNIFLFIPYLPHPSQIHQVSRYLNQDYLTDLIQSIVAVSFYATAQEHLFAIYGSATRTYIHLMTLAVLKILQSILEMKEADLNDQSIKNCSQLLLMCSSLIPLMIQSLKEIMSFEFHQVPNQTLVERLALKWLGFYRLDWNEVFNLSKPGSKPKLGNGIQKDIM